MNKIKDWDKWLSKKEEHLELMGYTKYIQDYKSEDFAWWKNFKDSEGNKLYNVGLLFYDFRKYADRDPSANRISIQYECMIICDNRIDLSVSNGISIQDFEGMAKDFYETMKKYE